MSEPEIHIERNERDRTYWVEMREGERTLASHVIFARSMTPIADRDPELRNAIEQIRLELLVC